MSTPIIRTPYPIERSIRRTMLATQCLLIVAIASMTAHVVLLAAAVIGR